MNPSKIHTKEFFDSLTDQEKFRIAEEVALTNRYHMGDFSFEEAMRKAHTLIEQERSDMRPSPVLEEEQCEATIKLQDEVHEGVYRCELSDGHDWEHHITYPGLDGYIEVPILFMSKDYIVHIRKGKQYYECAGCGYSTDDSEELTDRLCVDCSQLEQFNEESNS